MIIAKLFFQFFICIMIIFIGHQIYISLKNNFTQPITKNMYYTQVEKYKQIVDELQYEHKEQKQMEAELCNYVDVIMSSTTAL
jgi:hypothetical protein